MPFDEAGVPASWCIQEPADYDRTHHSQADTFDRVALERAGAGEKGAITALYTVLVEGDDMNEPVADAVQRLQIDLLCGSDLGEAHRRPHAASHRRGRYRRRMP